eukprot:gnl/MRDRNA2_/MRDRNA2_29383_c0_seq1.p1 gnl/MRDRNA2_/MRDRNA2_29383_c0~~gnl/MRDRNA2_/MRDRNA2_29383_c0_seq1.p1  ORF type:complete len:348 (+),score=116.83 gnl/MRDRNA2_/MRDRNA2_29383_c0_seq1:59-1102(+)
MTAGEAENVIVTVDPAEVEDSSATHTGAESTEPAQVTAAEVQADCDEKEEDGPDLPTFLEEREAMQKLVERSDKVEGWLEENLHGSGSTKDEDEKMPDVLEKMDQYKRLKDSQISQALPDLCQQAEFHKERGNEKMKEGKYIDAYNAYKAGFDLFKDFTRIMLDQDSKRLVVILYSNASQALLKCQDIQDASTDGARQMADKALELEPGNTKALFRRGMAYAKGGDTNLALDDFQQVLRLDPENVAARKEIRALQAVRKEQKRLKEETLEHKALRLETAAEKAVEAMGTAKDIRDKALLKVKDAEAALVVAQDEAKRAEEELLKAQSQVEEAEAIAKEARGLANGES